MAWSGDPGGTRTRDTLIKSQVLYRLSYRITFAKGQQRATKIRTRSDLSTVSVGTRLIHIPVRIGGHEMLVENAVGAARQVLADLPHEILIIMHVMP